MQGYEGAAMTVTQVNGALWRRKHDDPAAPTRPLAPRILYPTSLEEVIELCATRPRGERATCAGSHWSLSTGAVADVTFIETHDPNNAFPAMGRTLFDVVPRCLSDAMLDYLANQQQPEYSTSSFGENAGGDRAQGADSDSVLDGGGGRTGSRSIRSSCRVSPRPRSWARRCSGATTIKLFSSLIALVRLTKTPCRVANTCRSRFTDATLAGSGLMGLGERGPRRLNGVDRVALRAAGPLLVLDLDHVFAGLDQYRDQAGGEAAGPFQRPDPAPVRDPAGPRPTHAGSRHRRLDQLTWLRTDRLRRRRRRGRSCPGRGHRR